MLTAVGKFRKRLTLLAPPRPDADAQDSFGQPVLTYGDEGQLWGEVTALGGREYWQAQQTQALFTHRVRVRFCARALTIAKDWRLSYEGHTLNVEVPPRDVEGTRRELEILCKEVAP